MLHTQRGRLYRELHQPERVELTAILHEGRLVSHPPEFLKLLEEKYAASMQPLRAVDPTEAPPWEPNHPAQLDAATRLDPYELVRLPPPSAAAAAHGAACACRRFTAPGSGL
jgi:hypothetical protein